MPGLAPANLAHSAGERGRRTFARCGLCRNRLEPRSLRLKPGGLAPLWPGFAVATVRFVDTKSQRPLSDPEPGKTDECSVPLCGTPHEGTHLSVTRETSPSVCCLDEPSMLDGTTDQRMTTQQRHSFRDQLPLSGSRRPISIGEEIGQPFEIRNRVCPSDELINTQRRPHSGFQQFFAPAQPALQMCGGGLRR